MLIEYMSHMGDDLMVVNAARVSFSKQKNEIDVKDKKLIHYLAKHNHWTPFAHPQLQVRVTVPVFVGAQLKRHVVGFALNEVSRRYVDDEPTFYSPKEWRGRPEGSIKQGSSDEVVEWLCPTKLAPNSRIPYAYDRFIEVANKFYNNLISAGVAPEMARMVLPQSMNTSWIWTGSLAAFMRVYKQRIDGHAQKEVQEIAKQLGEILQQYWPVSFEALKSTV